MKYRTSVRIASIVLTLGLVLGTLLFAGVAAGRPGGFYQMDAMPAEFRAQAERFLNSAMYLRYDSKAPNDKVLAQANVNSAVGLLAFVDEFNNNLKNFAPAAPAGMRADVERMQAMAWSLKDNVNQMRSQRAAVMDGMSGAIESSPLLASAGRVHLGLPTPPAAETACAENLALLKAKLSAMMLSPDR